MKPTALQKKMRETIVNPDWGAKEYTTTQLVNVLGWISHQTISNWIDDGWIPGSFRRGNRRIVPHNALVRFLKERGIPTGKLESGHASEGTENQ